MLYNVEVILQLLNKVLEGHFNKNMTIYSMDKPRGIMQEIRWKYLQKATYMACERYDKTVPSAITRIM